jgi:hypothetical protein
MKGHRKQSQGCGCNSMTVLILLNILLIVIFLIIFALLGLSGNGGWNWFSRGGLETQPIQDPSMQMEQNGIDWNDPEQRSNVIYL